MKTTHVRMVLGALLAPMVLGGCSTMEIKSGASPEARFEGLKTYAWTDSRDKGDRDPRLDDPAMDQHIRLCVDRALQAQGFEAAPGESADFLVGYHLAIKTSSEVMEMNEDDGYTPGSGWGGNLDDENQPPFMQTGPQASYVRRFKQGSLVIDIVDPNTRNLLWRGSAEAELHEKNSQELQYRRVEEAVRKILREFPPA